MNNLLTEIKWTENVLQCSKTFPSKRKKVNLKKKAYSIAGAFYNIFGGVTRFTVLIRLASQLMFLLVLSFLFTPTTGKDTWMIVPPPLYVSKGRVMPALPCQGSCGCTCWLCWGLNCCLILLTLLLLRRASQELSFTVNETCIWEITWEYVGIFLFWNKSPSK